MNGIAPVLFLGLGILAIILFHFEIYFPIALSVAIFVGVSLFFIHRFKTKRLGVLLVLLWLVYALPFINIPPYLWFDFMTENPSVLWGLAVNPYMLDERIISLTAMLGAVGGLGMALGISLSSERLVQDYGLNPDGSRRHFRTMAMPIWLVWVVIGTTLSWLKAPAQTIFTVEYTQSPSLLENANFGSAWMISYIILTFAFCDALVETNLERKKIKLRFILMATAFVMIVLQLLRGDRESIPWVIGLAMIYFYWAAALTQRRGFTLPWSKITAVIAILQVVSVFVGALRHSLVGVSNIADFFSLIVDLLSGQLGNFSLLHGTWSGVLLTPLSVAGDYINGTFIWKQGQDYVDLILSIPPGFLADAVGYARPLDDRLQYGPAWEMTHGIGGTHAIVLPFRNFLITGVFVIQVAWSYVMIRYERVAIAKITVVNLSLLATLTMLLPHWLWYGEKYAFNALVLWGILAFFYRISLGLFRNQNASVSAAQPFPIQTTISAHCGNRARPGELPVDH